MKMGIIVFAQGEQLQEKAADTADADSWCRPNGAIYSTRNGNVLAKSANADTVVLRPSSQKGQRGRIVSVLSEILDIDEATVRAKATDIKVGGVAGPRSIRMWRVSCAS